MFKRIALLLAALCLGGMLTACSGSGNDPAATTPAATTPEETTGSEPAVEDIRLVVGGETDYVIVRPEVDKFNDTNTAMFLRSYLKSCGLNPRITTDWEGNGQAEHEIIIGHSDRLKETDLDLEAIGDKGYLMAARGGKIYLVGSNAKMTRYAVELFLTEFFGYAGDENVATVATDVTVPGDYFTSVFGTYTVSLEQLPQKVEVDAAVNRKLAYNIVGSGGESAAAEDPGENKVYVAWDVTASSYKKLQTSEIHNTADVSLKWSFNSANWTIKVERDLSAYKAYTFSVYADENAVGATFYMYFLSENPASDGMDYYGRKFTIDTAGWNHFSGTLRYYGTSREPRGWDQIDQLVLTSTGWNQNNDPRTVLYMDNLYLYTQETVAAVAAHYYNIDDSAAFSLHGSRSIINQVLIENSYIDDDSVVFEENGVYYLPLAPFAAYHDKDSEYNASTHVLTMTYGGRKYVFTGDSDKATVDGKSESLGFKVRVNGDSLFVPHTYAMQLFGYSELYTDPEMGLIVLSNEKKEFPDDMLSRTLEISYATLFERPTGDEIVREMYTHLQGDVHPRVMLRQDDFDRLKSYINTDETFTAWYNNLVSRYGPESSEFKKAPVEYALTDGVRLLSRSREAMNRIIPMSLLYKLSGNKQYAERVWSEVNALCRFPDWHPAHYLDTAEILFPMAIAYDWLYDYWTPERREIMEAATLEFGLKTGLDRYEGRAGIWGSNNWTGVCNGGLVAAAIAYNTVYPDECTRILGYAVTDLERSMYSYAPDGGYLESPGYWAYGTNYTMIMMAALESATGRDYGLFYSPGFAASAYFIAYFETEVGSWGFHDSGSGQNETMTLSWFAKKSGDGALNRLRMNSIDAKLKPVHAFDLMFYDPNNITDTVELNLDAYYRQVGSVTMRSSWENGAIFVGLHGGSNSASHGDLDIGNFVLDAAGTRFFTELGSDDYNIPGYFGDLRWTYYRKRAEGQNTLVIGKVSYKTPDQIAAAVARFQRVESNAASAIAVVDTTPAYKKMTNMTSGTRGILFTDDRSTVILQDEAFFSKTNTVRWGAHTPGTIIINEGGRSAFIKRGNVYLYCEIVSDDPTLRFSSAAAKSYDPNYPKTPGSKTENGNKLMIITEDGVTEFKCAVVMKVIREGETAPALGATYQWTDMADWKLQ